jgi:hypothetical protein
LRNVHMNNTVSKRVALSVATLSSFLTPFMGSSINIALPPVVVAVQRGGANHVSNPINHFFANTRTVI